MGRLILGRQHTAVPGPSLPRGPTGGLIIGLGSGERFSNCAAGTSPF